MTIEGKTVLVTGANRGIGQALAAEALARGASRVYAGKASPESVALAIFDAIDHGEEDIFPDPTSAAMADSWRTDAAKALERQLAQLAPVRS